jgi:hypothetical protein
MLYVIFLIIYLYRYETILLYHICKIFYTCNQAINVRHIGTYKIKEIKVLLLLYYYYYLLLFGK